jgi:hypothetical protein
VPIRLTSLISETGLRRDALCSQVIDVLETPEIKETGNEEDWRVNKSGFAIMLLAQPRAAFALGTRMVNKQKADGDYTT